MKRIIDSHIHLDVYKPNDQKHLLETVENYQVTDLITVSNHLSSSIENLAIARKDKRIHPAFGFHPEQAIPTKSEVEKLTNFIDKHQDEMIAVGEVGLPYYLRKEQKGINLDEHIDLLEHFIKLAKKYDKPIILHAVYEDAEIACHLLEKYGVKKAHFHWFKGDTKTLKRMKENGYYISVPPEVVYKEKIKWVASNYPLTHLMVETDGPWLFEGPFENKMTHPQMIHASIEEIAKIKNINLETVYRQIYENTIHFYELPER